MSQAEDKKKRAYTVLRHPADGYIVVEDGTYARYYTDLDPIEQGLTHQEAWKLIRRIKAKSHPQAEPSNAT